MKKGTRDVLIGASMFMLGCCGVRYALTSMPNAPKDIARYENAAMNYEALRNISYNDLDTECCLNELLAQADSIRNDLDDMIDRGIDVKAEEFEKNQVKHERANMILGFGGLILIGAGYSLTQKGVCRKD